MKFSRVVAAPGSDPHHAAPHRRWPISILPILVVSLLLGGASSAFGWGSAAHRFINKNAVVQLPPTMAQLAAQQTFLTDHASDADSRKSVDTGEAPKHYLDLESYPDYSHLPADLTVLVNQYGWTTVAGNGILPWAIMWAEDSLTAQFRRGDLVKAYQTAADLGHYVGDAHQPLHCTVNYDGKLTGNSGIHSRYETGMINAYESSLTVQKDSIRYINDIFGEAMRIVLHSHDYVDSILQADSYAKTVSGWNGSGQPPAAYFSALWDRTGSFTALLIQEATVRLASLWYTAWVNAGLTSTSVPVLTSSAPVEFRLEQNYPNPFNPATIIRYTIPGTRGQGSGTSNVRLVIYDALGRMVAALVSGMQSAGTYEVKFDGSKLSSGMYFVRLTAGDFAATRSMILLR